MSHPNKKRAQDRRTKRHMLLLTEAEHASYTRLAKDSKMSLNEWIRTWLPTVSKDSQIEQIEDVIARATMAGEENLAT